MLDMSAVAVSDRLSLSLSRHIWSSHNQDAASFRRLSSDASLNRNGRCHLLHRNMSTNAFHRGKQFLQVKATVGYPASISWWKKGDQQRNMQEITSGDQFYDALAAAAREDKLVLVDFYSTGCRSCKVLYPKVRNHAIRPDLVSFLMLCALLCI
ncbi:hypothetical protein L7F22_063514 [Adiantum nelumboides]|nr:hypothetical protein [Adiantum nelumboides]